MAAEIKSRIFGGWIGRILAGAAVSSMLIGTAFAITANTFSYSRIKTGYYSIHPGALAPIDTLAASNYNVNFVNPSMDTGSGSSVCFSTGINLPNGASIVSLTIFYQSNASSNISALMTRLALSTGIPDNFLFQIISDDSDVRRRSVFPVPAASQFVDNSAYAYALAVCIAAGTTFNGARIRYTYKTAGD